MARFCFPEWTNRLTRWVLLGVVGAPIYLIALVAYGVAPATLRVGYQPVQPIPYSHALHAGELGIDCRYCHGAAERSPRAAIPTAASCLRCHDGIRPDSVNLAPLRAPGLRWVRVHDLPDYVAFDHRVHLARGVGCETCHGRADRMERVYQATALTMAWCLDCHRAPASSLRPPAEVAVMGYVAPPGLGDALRTELAIDPPTNCSTCHR
jgi:hypothetical protein